MKKISAVIVSRVTELARDGHTTRKIAELVKISQSSVSRILKNNSSDRIMNKGGRPKKISDRVAREIGRKLISGECNSPKEALFGPDGGRIVDASIWTVRRALRSVGLKPKEKKKKPALSAKNIKLRKEFVKKYESWSENDWKQVLDFAHHYFLFHCDI